MEAVLRLNERLSAVVWGWPMLALLVLAGVVFSVRTRFVQFRRFGDMLHLTLGAFSRREPTRPGEVTPLQAMTTALAATVGTGNIAGVAGAIALGGPGAVFWMWVSAFLGMATKYAEVVLAVRYRQRAADGRFYGGPMYYICALGRGFRPLAWAFALLGALAAFGIGNMVQANTAADAATFALAALFPGLTGAQAPLRTTVGILLSLAVTLALTGGAALIGRATERLVPWMSALYALAALTVILRNLPGAGRALGDIVRCAFSPESALGGAAGIGMRAALRCGMERGMFSHEAGMGSAPIAHAGAQTEAPDRQGLFGIFEVFADTIVICTLTALAILASGAKVPYGRAAGSELVIFAFGTAFGNGLAALLTAACLALFALSTMLAWSLYGERCFAYLTGGRATALYRALFALAAALGASMRLEAVWALAGTLNGLMAAPNLVALFPLSGEVARISRHIGQKPRGGCAQTVLY
ncbi:MAG TPA: sodium:alanine symporter family protein [Candidatus Pullichristensenella avicola]|nr:sodium:alanine symporter family protein [Candidatus Pullichristensenella avicola]